MPIRCPECNTPLSNNICELGHRFELENGCLILQEKSFKSWFDTFELNFQAYRKRKNLRIESSTIFDQLPFVDDQLCQGNWKEKEKDLNILRGLIKEGTQDVLEIGAWNHWLTNQLHKEGHQLTAVDYFIDEFDGLGAKKHYTNNNWVSIQMNLEKLCVIDVQFDVIIVNRSVIYFKDPIALLEDLKGKLKANGSIVVTGAITSASPEKFMNRFLEKADEFEKNEKFSIAIKPFYGALGAIDLAKLNEIGYKIHSYPLSLKQSISRLIKRPQEKMVYPVGYTKV